MVTQRDPFFNEPAVFRSAFDRFFDDALGRPSRWWQGEGMGVDVDVIERDDAYEVRAALSGVKPEIVAREWDDQAREFMRRLVAERR